MTPGREYQVPEKSQDAQDKGLEEFEKLLSDFKRREQKFDQELMEKEDAIRKLQEMNFVSNTDMTKTSSHPFFNVKDQDLGRNAMNIAEDNNDESMAHNMRTTQTNALARDKENVKDSKYVQLIETRMAECLEENKRYHMKYCDLRDFSYTQIETLVRQLNSKKKSSVQNSNLNVYKQLFEKERKQWMQEKEKSDEALSRLQDAAASQDKDLKEQKQKTKSLMEEVEQRSECEAKI